MVTERVILAHWPCTTLAVLKLLVYFISRTRSSVVRPGGSVVCTPILVVLTFGGVFCPPALYCAVPIVPLSYINLLVWLKSISQSVGMDCSLCFRNRVYLGEATQGRCVMLLHPREISSKKLRYWTSNRVGRDFFAITFECVASQERNFGNGRFRPRPNFYY